MVKVSVIVPVHKVENYLSQCLDSILSQTLQDIEIIIIDEGDKDRCREIIDIYERLDPRILTFHQRNQGYGASVNRGIKAASGKYIGFVESDDIIIPEMFEILYDRAELFQADISKAAFYCYSEDSNGRATQRLAPLMEACAKIFPLDRSFTLDQYPFLLSFHPSIYTAIYRTDWLRETGILFFPSGPYVDHVFRYRTMAAAKRIVWCNKPVYKWRINNPTSTNGKWNVEAALKQWELFHEQFKKSPELWDKYSLYILPEETKNIYMQINFGWSNNWIARAEKLLATYPKKVIDNCPWITEEFRNDFLRGRLRYLLLKRGMRKCYQIIKCEDFQRSVYRCWFAAIIFLFTFKLGYFIPMIGKRFNDFFSTLFAAVAFIATFIYAVNLGMLYGYKTMKFCYGLYTKQKRIRK